MINRSNVYRIVDVNLNRASEGLRVLEDVARFMYDDAQLTLSLKRLRHEISCCGEKLGTRASILVCREARADVGKGLPEAKRKELRSLIEANFKRVEQALRSLEEHGKLISPSIGDEFRVIRFRVYELEQALLATAVRKADYRLYAVTESAIPREMLLAKVRHAVASGVTAIQLREKSMCSAEFFQRAQELRAIIPERVVFIINDRIDVALASEADGVHLGQDDLPVKAARKLVGEGMIIGCSTHTVQQAIEAVDDGADYVAVGPLFFTSTKTHISGPVGPEMVGEVSSVVQVPVIGIGGINAENVSRVFAAGASGVACVSAVFGGDDIPAQTSSLLRVIDGCC